jgi:hypothetical protein
MTATIALVEMATGSSTLILPSSDVLQETVFPQSVLAERREILLKLKSLIPFRKLD